MGLSHVDSDNYGKHLGKKNKVRDWSSITTNGIVQKKLSVIPISSFVESDLESQVSVKQVICLTFISIHTWIL